MDDFFILNDYSDKANYSYNVNIRSYSQLFEAFIVKYLEKFGDITNQIFISKYRKEMKRVDGIKTLDYIINAEGK